MVFDLHEIIFVVLIIIYNNIISSREIEFLSEGSLLLIVHDSIKKRTSIP